MICCLTPPCAPFDRCLEENAFNYDRALQVFNQLKLENKVPPEAFLPA